MTSETMLLQADRARALLKGIKEIRPYQVYLWGTVAVGMGLIVTGLWRLLQAEAPLNFLLLLLLAAVAEVSATTVRISEKAGITFGVGDAVAMAALPIFGPLPATLIVVATNLGLWLIKPRDGTTWKKNWTQLSFNTSMHAISLFMAGIVFTLLQTWVGTDTILAVAAAWLAAAVVFDQTNAWLLMGVLRLQHGSEFHVFELWRQNIWAIPINIVVLSVGGVLLSYAMARFDWLGVAIFFLPVFLSAYAFRLYVHHMQEHMDNLENIVAERTKELARRTEQLAEANRQKDVFLAILSHDMKTPLASIKIYNDLLHQYPELLAENSSITDDISQSLLTLDHLVNNILDLEKIASSSEPLPLRMEKFSIDEAVGAAVKTLKAQAWNKEITLQYQPDALPAPIMGDFRQLERVFLNLISNAIKYTPTGGTIDVAVSRREEWACVEVSDSGYGIPADDIPFVFERFRRVDKLKNQAAGTGLGLAIAKALVETHEGKILVHSTEGIGSTFAVLLPLMPD